MDISPLQFGLAIAVAPVSSLVAALVIYMANNKSGKSRADEIKADLSKQIDGVKSDLSANLTQFRAEVRDSLDRVDSTILRLDSKIDSKIDKLEDSVRDSFEMTLKASISDLKVSIADSQNRSIGRAASHGDGD